MDAAAAAQRGASAAGVQPSSAAESQRAGGSRTPGQQGEQAGQPGYPHRVGPLPVCESRRAVGSALTFRVNGLG